MILSKFSLLLFLIVFVEAFVVLVLLNQSSQGILGGDATFYHQTAICIVKEGSFALICKDTVTELTISKTPGHSFFIAVIYFFTGNSILAVRIVQFMLFWLIALGVYRLARFFVNEETSKLSAILSVTYIPIIFLPIFHLSEILATFLVVWTICKAVEWKENNNRFDVILTSLLFASLILVRPNWALLVIPIFLIIYVLSKNKSLLNLTIFAIICVAFVSPWLVRNYLLLGKLSLSLVTNQVLYTSALQYSGKISYAFTADEWQTFLADMNVRMNSINEQTKSTQNDTIVQKEFLLEESYKASLKEELQNLSILQILKSLPKRIAYLWSTADLAPIEIYNGFYHRLAQIHYLLITFLTLLGLFLRRNFLKTDWILLAPAIYITLIHIVFHIEPRYSIPARPFLLIFASVGIIWIINKGKSVLRQKDSM